MSRGNPSGLEMTIERLRGPEKTELNAGAPVPLVARPVQAKHYFMNFVAAFPELFAALVSAILEGKELTQFRRDASFGRPSSFDMLALLVGCDPCLRVALLFRHF